jgi:PAS domain S-box-containing protein
VDHSSNSVPGVRSGFSWLNHEAAPDILAEIVHVQREYVRQGDPQRMWDLLLDAVIRTSFSQYGFIGEVEWSDSGIPNLVTRSIVWGDPSARSLHPDVALLVSQVVATEQPVVLTHTPDAPSPSRDRMAPIRGFLGLPLLSADRLVAVIGVSAPAIPYEDRIADLLQPLLSTCASIVESLQASAARDRAVARLESTASFLDAVFETAPMGIVAIDERGRIARANPAALRTLGFPAGALNGTPVWGLVDDGAAGAVRRLVARFISHGVSGPLATNAVVEAVRLDGSRFPAEVSVSEMRVGDARNLVAVFQDIGERLSAQRSLAKAAEILDATPDVVVWGSDAGDIEYLNRSATRLLGNDRTFDHLIVADDAGRFESARQWARQHGAWSGELRLQDRDQGSIPASVVLIHQRSDERAGWLAMLARDQSERYEVDRLKDSFVSNVSHELRTPLTSILGYLELLEEGDDVTPSQAGLLAVIRRNGDRLLHLIGQILAVASVERPEKARAERIDLELLIEEVLRTMEINAHLKGIRLKSTFAPAVIVGDRGEIFSALANVISNAVKFTPSGGEISVTTSTCDDWVSIEVVDNGIGIHPDDIDRIRDRFFRGSLAQLNEIQGTGLGLAIVEAVVKRSSGHLEITSQVGEGTTVQLRFPAADGLVEVDE